MTSRETLRERIFWAIARTRIMSQQPEAVLTAIEETHVLVPKEMPPIVKANLVIAVLRETLQGEEFGREVDIGIIVDAFLTVLANGDLAPMAEGD